MKLTELNLKEFTDLMGSDAPAPGGGSAAALAGSMGASLGRMVAALTTGKEKYAHSQELVEEVIQKLSPIAESLLLAVDRDTEAFNGVSAVFSMPKSTDEEKAARKEAMQTALKNAAAVPMEVMELCHNALVILEQLIGNSNTNAASDLGVAALSLKTGLLGAWLNVKINLGGIKDEAFTAHLAKHGEELSINGSALADRIYEAIHTSL